MTLELLDLLELVAVPALDCAVLGGTEEDVAFVVIDRVGDEGYLHDTVFVTKERFVTIAKVETPDTDVLVRGTGRDEFAVAGDRHVEHRQLVAIEVEEELQRVDEKDLDSVVERCYGEEFRVGRNLHAQNIIVDL